jgi:hypothetical protein
MSEKAATEVCVVWRNTGGHIQFLGAYESEAAAKRDLDFLNDPQLRFSTVMLLGWAFNKETGRVYSNEDPAPPTSGSVQ